MKIFKVILILLGLLHKTGFSSESLVHSVADLMNVKPCEISLKPQDFGMTSSKSYEFEVKNQKLLLKVFSEKQTIEQRIREIEIVKILSDLKIGTNFIAKAKDNSFYIREYIDGKPATYADFQNETILKNMAKVLQKLHKHKTNINARSQLDRFEKHYKSIQNKQIALPSGFEKEVTNYRSHMSKIKKLLGFCHNDLNLQNIIISNDKIYLIDLGNCGNSNIYEDLGYFILLSGITGEKLVSFLKAYFERAPSQDELNATITASKLTSFLTATVWFDFSESLDESSEPYPIRQKILNDMLYSPDLPSVLDIVKSGKFVSVKSENKQTVKSYALSFYKDYLHLLNP